MNSMLKVSLSLVAFVSLVSIATLADAGTGIGGKPGGAVSGATQYRAYSYEPAPLFLAGNLVVIAKAKADLKLGDRVLATVPQGTQFKIVQVWGNWLGATIEQNGKKISGWITNADVASSAAPAVPTAP
jgi:hypothetical protein